MSDVCGDNRFEIIEAYKKRLIEDTNIESRPDEMAVIDNILLRFWQMGWLPSAQPDVPDTNVGDTIYREEAIKKIAEHLGIPAENWMKIAEEWLRDVPSAQPDLQQTCNKLATDCISIEKLLTFYERRAKELKGVYGDLGGACSGVAKSIKLLTAQPERRQDEVNSRNKTC